MSAIIGEVACPYCTAPAPVKKNKLGDLYFTCQHCGVSHMRGRRAQEWMLDHAKLYGADGPPDEPPAIPSTEEAAEETPPPVAAPESEPVNEPVKEKQKPSADWLGGW